MNSIVSGLHTAFDDSGKGPVVVMLHGWGSDRSTFSDLTKQLVQSYRVIAIDLPGFGGTQAPPEPWGVAEYTAFVADVLNKRKVAEIDILIGHSMGGRISLLGCGRQIFSPRKLVLLGSHGIAESKSMRNRAFKGVAKVGKAASSILPASTQQRLKSSLYARAGATDYLSAGAMQETFKKVIATDAREDAKSITSDTLLVYGADDEQTPPAFGRILSDVIAQSRLEVLPGAGHYVHIDKADEVQSLIKEFVS